MSETLVPAAGVRIREATVDDVPGIVEILNDAIDTTTAVWSEERVSLESRVRWLEERTAAGNPVLVADDGAVVVGFASFGEFRPSPGYRLTVELSIYVRGGRRGQGVGRLLLAALIDRATTLGKRVMIAGIEASNEASLRLHASAGFLRGGHLPAVGVKFGRPLDLVLMYLRLDRSPELAEGGARPPERRAGVAPLAGLLVRLEPLAAEHLAGLERAAADLPTLPYSFVPRDARSSARYLADAIAGRDTGTEWPFATIRSSDGQLVGTTRYLGISVWEWPGGDASGRSNGLPDSVEIGATWLARSAWRTGINVEAKLLMLAHAFEVWRVHRVMLCTDARNERSRVAIEALGALFEGIRRADRPAADGAVRDTACFSITEGDWPAVRARLEQRLLRAH